MSDQKKLWIVVCLDGNDSIIDVHGVYDTKQLAKEEVDKMNSYEATNHPNDDIYYKVFKKLFVLNDKCPLGLNH